MKRRRRSTRSVTIAAGTAVAALGAALLAPVSAAQQQPLVTTQDATEAETFAVTAPELANPLGEKREALKQEAHERLITGQARPQSRNGSDVVELASGEFVEVATTGTDRIFTILVEFGDDVHAEFGGDPGPRANEIAEPDRAVDNTTIWQDDFDRQHFEDLYYSDDAAKDSVKQYFEDQSSGRYSVEGHVTDWVKVDYNEARYGNTACGSSVCESVWEVVRDGVNAWYEDQLDRGLSLTEIREILAEYDVEDRYDYNGDGNFNEPDGYLDHFQIVHAGEDASAGGGAQGDDAIWAHRWYAFSSDMGVTGPDFNLAGGAEIGDTGLWVGDYTIQPENGGVGVFAHEYAHDLGLPDLYDTAGGENSTGFWSAMSSGSWLGRGDGEIGTLPNDMGPWEKLQLGWLDYDVAQAGSLSGHRLGASADQYPDDRQGTTAQSLIVELPDKTVTTELTEPASGEAQWWSGMGNELNSTLTRTVDLSGGQSAELAFTGWWDIEEGYDFLYVEASADSGGSWQPLDGTADGETIPRDSSDRPALHGESGGHAAMVYSLDEYLGEPVDLRFRYRTDTAMAELGFIADDLSVAVDGEVLFADDVEGGEGEWNADGFQIVGASITDDYPQFYLVENRQYVSYDETLKTGPYNFGFLDDRPDWAEHFAYQNGMLVWLWDTSQRDNNTSVHPGEGLILPVDAHAGVEHWADGSVLRNRIQSRDATFSWFPTKSVTLHNAGEPTKLRAAPGAPFFDDRKGTYWSEENPQGSVRVPDTNTRISILHQPLKADRPMTVLVSPSTLR